MNTAPVPALELLVFMNVAPAPDPASVRFHTLVFSFILACLKLNGK